MATINVSEADFDATATAACEAYRAKDFDLAESLDRLARKINAALSHRQGKSIPGFKKPPQMHWTEVPCTYEHLSRGTDVS